MGASIIDQLFAKEGCLDPDLVGIHQAKAADTEWDSAFLARVVSEAAVAGFHVVRIAGCLQVANIIALRRPYTDAKEN
jgi:hypothetical protein